MPYRFLKPYAKHSRLFTSNCHLYCYLTRPAALWLSMTEGASFFLISLRPVWVSSPSNVARTQCSSTFVPWLAVPQRRSGLSCVCVPLRYTAAAAIQERRPSLLAFSLDGCFSTFFVPRRIFPRAGVMQRGPGGVIHSAVFFATSRRANLWELPFSTNVRPAALLERVIFLCPRSGASSPTRL